MSYNWQNGELITAEKLNQTGGGSDVLVVHGTLDEENETLTVVEDVDNIFNVLNDGGTVTLDVAIIQNSEVTPIHSQFTLMSWDSEYLELGFSNGCKIVHNTGTNVVLSQEICSYGDGEWSYSLESATVPLAS